MSFPRYPKYKASGVEWLGEVPAHWELTRLGRVAALNPSKSESHHLERSQLVSFLPMEAVGEDGSLDLSRQRPIGELEAGYTYFRDGDVVVAKITPCFENGKGALMTSLQAGVGFGTSELIVIRPNLDAVRADFLLQVTRSPVFRMRGEAEMYGAGGQKRVPDDFVRGYQMPMPPLQEQGAIAAFLDRETAKIDALVAEQQRLIELLKEKRQAVISHAVTKGLDPNAKMKPSGIEWLGDVPAHWEVGRLEHAGSFIWGKAHEPFVDEGGSHVCVTARFVATNGEARKMCTQNLTRAQWGDILMVMSDLPNGRALARAFLVQDADSYAINQRVCAVRISKGDKQYFYYQLDRHPALLAQDDGCNQTHLSNHDFMKLLVAMPPPPEQLVIAQCVSLDLERLRALSEEATKAVSLLQERRTALISAAVTGQIDVRHLAFGTA